ncbi:MAG: hypothetical protein AAB263_04460, partial [Planctomycetota bacterium]
RLIFNTTSTAVAKGFRTHASEIQVRRAFGDGTSLFDADPVTVTLVNSDASKATFPATLTIAGGSATASFAITGVDLTGATPLVVDATAAGYQAPTDKLSVSVIPPPLEFVGLELQRSTLTPSRNGFTLRVNVPGSVNPLSQVATAQQTVNLTVTNANPAGIVQIFDSSTGGNIVTQTTICNGCGSTSTRYVGQPSGPGSYTINADIPGLAAAQSGVVTVSGAPARVSFPVVAMTVGKGLRSYDFTVSLQRIAYSGSGYDFVPPLTVNLVSSDPALVSVPASVTIPAGQSSSYFTVMGLDLTGTGPVTITASADGLDPSTTPLVVNVVQPSVTLAGLDGNRFLPGGTDNFCVQTFVPGAADGGLSQSPVSPITVDLSLTNASNPNLVAIVDNVGNPMTQTTLASASACNLYMSVPTMTGTYTVTSSAAGYGIFTSPVQTVRNGGTFTFSRTAMTVPMGATSNSAITITRGPAAGAPGLNVASPLTVTLTSSDPTRATVPATVTIPGFSTTTSFSVTGNGLTNGVPVTITASATNFDPPATPLSVNVIEPAFQINGLAGDYSTGLAVRDDFFVSLLQTVGETAFLTAATPLTLDLSVVDLGTNLARNATVRASSLWPFTCNEFGNCESASAPVSVVTDGIHTPSSPSLRTTVETHAWWEADLGSVQSFGRIYVYFPSSTQRVAILLASQPFVEADFTAAALPGTYSNGATLVYLSTGLENSNLVQVSGSFSG